MDNKMILSFLVVGTLTFADGDKDSQEKLAWRQEKVSMMKIPRGSSELNVSLDEFGKNMYPPRVAKSKDSWIIPLLYDKNYIGLIKVLPEGGRDPNFGSAGIKKTGIKYDGTKASLEKAYAIANE